MVPIGRLRLSDKSAGASRYPAQVFPGVTPGLAAPTPRTQARASAMRKSRDSQMDRVMDNEQINAIGTLLADLTHRTEQLRGYL
jgi:hypothetical protein